MAYPIMPKTQIRWTLYRSILICIRCAHSEPRYRYQNFVQEYKNAKLSLYSISYATILVFSPSSGGGTEKRGRDGGEHKKSDTASDVERSEKDRNVAFC